MPTAARETLIREALSGLTHWARLLRSSSSPPFHGIHLSPTQLDVLFVVAHTEAPLTSTMLATRLGVTPGAVTQVVDRLVAMGLVERRPHPTDARSKVVCLSSEAAHTIEGFERDMAAQVAHHFAAFSDHELATVARLLLPSPSENP